MIGAFPKKNEARLKAYRDGDFIDLEALYSACNYFPKDIFTFTKNEVFADVGAFDGGTSFEFGSVVKREYEHIYAFEPSQLCATLAARKFVLYNIVNAEVHRYAIGDKVGTLAFDENFSSGGEGGYISENGSVTVPCTTLDEFFKGFSPPSMIKMDVEGAEVAALAGARRIIAEGMPKLAVCVYHRLEDLWEVPIKIYEAQTG